MDRTDRTAASFAEAHLDALDAGELRSFVAYQLADANAHPYAAEIIGHGIDRLASLLGNLPQVLRDLANDVEVIRESDHERALFTQRFPRAVEAVEALARRDQEAALARRIADLPPALSATKGPQPARVSVDLGVLEQYLEGRRALPRPEPTPSEPERCKACDGEVTYSGLTGWFHVDSELDRTCGSVAR